MLRIFASSPQRLPSWHQLANALRSACRPSIACGAIAGLTRSRAELIAENAFLRQQLIVAPRGAKRPVFRGCERSLLVLLASLLPGAVPCSSSNRRPCAGTAPDSASSGVEGPDRPVPVSGVSTRMSSLSSRAWRPRTASGGPSAFAVSTRSSASALRSGRSNGTCAERVRLRSASGFRFRVNASEPPPSGRSRRCPERRATRVLAPDVSAWAAPSLQGYAGAPQSSTPYIAARVPQRAAPSFDSRVTSRSTSSLACGPCS